MVVEHIVRGAMAMAVLMVVVAMVISSTSTTTSASRRHGEWGSWDSIAKCGVERLERRGREEVFNRSRGSSFSIYFFFSSLVQKRAGDRREIRLFGMDGEYINFRGAVVW
jgi:hypothetical protein